MQQGPRVAVIGLDCGTPQLLFRDLIDEIPNIRKLMDGGMHGDLASITPPITVPAWACAMTGKTPGQLGLYGFRNRKDHTYDGLSIATSGSIHEPAVWDKLAEKGMRSLLIGVPPSFPPPKEFPGWRIGCFLTPPSAKRFAFPEELEVEVAEELGGPGNYIFDIPNFREQGMQFVLDQVFAMTERRFKVARRLVKNKPWDYFMMVEMGPDRLHHVFWQYFDPRHPLYVPGNEFETAFQDYYRFLDREVGALLDVLPDDAITIVMSDHGARPMMGGLCFNDWLMQEGYLAMTEKVTEPTPIAKAPVDWSRTIAWGDGGYYGRCFLNVKGREPQGVIEPERYEEVRDELVAKLEAAPGPGRAAARHEGAEAAGRLSGGPRRRARPARVLRRPGMALDGLGRQLEPLHLRERHRSRRGQPRSHGHLRDEEPARAAHGSRRRHEPGRRRSHHPQAV